MQTTSSITATPHLHEDEDYSAFLTQIQANAALLIASGSPLFTTGVTGLFDAFLLALPVGRQKHYTCNACRRFVSRYGNLVTISPEGVVTPLFWNADTAPPFFRNAVATIARIVSKSLIEGVFLTNEPVWGLPVNRDRLKGESGAGPGVWHHMAWTPPATLLFTPPALKTCDAVMAEKREEHAMLVRGLGEFSVDVVRQAHALLSGGHLPREEKCIGVAKFLLDLHEARGRANHHRLKETLTWRAVATAPGNYCHVKSGMIGTLLEDVANGLPFEEIKRKWAEKMDPLRYMRPQAPPTVGNLKQAEKLVEAMGLASALERRFAKVEEVEALWRPSPPKPASPPVGGVFGHLHPAADRGMCVPPVTPTVTMTWVKFQRDVLPGAESIELYVPGNHVGFAALVTAKHPNAKPILQWDRADKRNPFSWYLYKGGSYAIAWNLKPRVYVPVKAICYQPSMWGGDPTAFPHAGKSVFFLIEGARDLNYSQSGGFFPESLKGELHAVRATMEAYAQNATIEGAETATACGVKYEAGTPFEEAIFRVKSKGIVGYVKLDRWE